MLAWLSLYNNQGNSAVPVTGGKVPITEMLLLLPAMPNIGMANAF
jgi:hypothetical protein